MKAIQLASFGIIPAALFLLACGDDVTKVTKIEETSGMEIIASADSLGKCTPEISGEMKFATKENALFVCADSAWKNVSETEKTTCSAEALSDGSGFKIVCDGDSVGVVKNGANGTDGKKGEAGKDGANGEGCKLVDGPVREAGSSLVQTSFVVCGGDTVGTISDGRPGEGCDISDVGDGTVSVVCGETSTTLYKAFCGGKVYNPDSSFCFADSIVPLCGGKAYDLDSSFCVENLIVPQTKKLVWNLMNPDIEYGVFVDDRDDQVYRSVKIGEQTWMAENLNYAYNQETSSLDSSSFCYNNEPGSCAKYGRLYLWSAAMDSVAKFSEAGKGCGNEKTCISAATIRGVCPRGWHLPSNAEFEALIKAVGGKSVAGKALSSISGWEEDYGNGTDSFGFSALPTGFRNFDGNFCNVGYQTFLRTSSEYNSSSDYNLHLRYRLEAAYLPNRNKNSGISVRCVRD